MKKERGVWCGDDAGMVWEISGGGYGKNFRKKEMVQKCLGGDWCVRGSTVLSLIRQFCLAVVSSVSSLTILSGAPYRWGLGDKSVEKY